MMFIRPNDYSTHSHSCAYPGEQDVGVCSACKSGISRRPIDFRQIRAESARIGREIADRYHRYQIETEEVDDANPVPHRFLVKVGKVGLA